MRSIEVGAATWRMWSEQAAKATAVSRPIACAWCAITMILLLPGSFLILHGPLLGSAVIYVPAVGVAVYLLVNRMACRARFTSAAQEMLSTLTPALQIEFTVVDVFGLAKNGKCVIGLWLVEALDPDGEVCVRATEQKPPAQGLGAGFSTMDIPFT